MTPSDAWWAARTKASGSCGICAGLSRIERVSATTLNQLLRAAHASPLFSEFESALPIVAIDGTVVTVRARSICVHGDTPGAVDLARAVRAALDAAGVGVYRFTD